MQPIAAKFGLSVVLALSGADVLASSVTATTGQTRSGEKTVTVLATFKQPPSTIWKWFSTEEGYRCWIAPVVKLDMRIGGTVQTNYDKTAKIGEPGTISLPIVNYVENQVLTFKVNLNDKFPANIRAQDERLQEVIQLQALPNGGTRLVSTMVGWGLGEEWEKAAKFFVQGNEWTYKNLAACVAGGRPSLE